MKGEFGWKRNIKAVLKPAPARARRIKKLRTRFLGSSLYSGYNEHHPPDTIICITLTRWSAKTIFCWSKFSFWNEHLRILQTGVLPDFYFFSLLLLKHSENTTTTQASCPLNSYVYLHQENIFLLFKKMSVIEQPQPKVKCLKVKEKDIFCKRKRERAEKISNWWSQARKWWI